MSKTIFKQLFFAGFIFGIFLFIGLNIYSINANYGGWDNFGKSGFPFSWIDSDWFLQRILWLGLIADILAALIFSFLLGLTLEFVRSKVSLRHLK